MFALGSVPSAPGTPTKNIPNSSKDSIMVTWTPVSSDTLNVLGYKLYADSGHVDAFHLVFDGT